MNIALPALFILILIIPGFIFLNTYEKVENTSLEKKPFDVSFSLAIFATLLLHSLLNFFINNFIAPIDYTICIKFLLGMKSISDSDITNISDSVEYFVGYILVSFLLAYVLGKLAQFVIFKLNPYKSSPLAFDTPWYYELKGKLSETKDAQIIKISCLVESNNASLLYYGILEDFHLDIDGQLNRIVLSDVLRRPLDADDALFDEPLNDEPSLGLSSRFYEIKGDRLMLK